ncbi:protealysin inhibitor emfourin [Nocardioides rubriscoriae]|uniref:protealysin inhibitor emfourin n=1 Tax=Nocardioides rubriscoriae TaxID=642762 RepID=UPI0011E03895|nr:protealysin inhibitor emfourin [Nocardioides rubriscoriae]
MRISLRTDGGLATFPGLTRPVEVDSSSLGADEAARLEHLVGAARFFARPEPAAGPAPGTADAMTYTLTVDDGTRTRTLTVSDPLEDDDLAALISHLRAL